ncbi:mannosyl-oligosaccharide 1,2-alpha-mannosidase IC-like [Genypterus blacodes]|uniref:mannosyl-oligosaccharide 1,2-alpha-mannosidase IC-like n=1 Tax=Genypterus blacodes TaxID=154954 RepID=UPI003F76C8E6
MVFRKLPGVSASGMGLRLSQKFVFLLFLSGLVTLCFGALFFLPDSVRLKRIFLSKTETQPVTVGSGSGSGSENDAREHLKRAREQERPARGGAGSGKGATISGAKVKSLSRKESDERLNGGKAPEDSTLVRPNAEPGPEGATPHSDTSIHARYQRCLIKPALGMDMGKPSDPRTEERRNKVREVRRTHTGGDMNSSLLCGGVRARICCQKFHKGKL